MASIHINISSNFNRCEKIKLALVEIKNQFANVVTSSIYKSKSEKFITNDFYNIGVNANTEKNADKVIKILKEIEINLGRCANLSKQNKIVIDLDLILFDNLIDNNLNLPNNEITKYAHILAPLAEINENKIHPIKGINFKNIWGEFKINNKLSMSMYNIDFICK